MDTQIFSRSRVLNSIPPRKLQDKQSSILLSCSACSSKTTIDGLCKDCSLKIRAVNRYYEANIPIEYWALKMDKDFVGDKRLLEKYNELTKDIKKCFIEGKSVCFAGQYGIGKTMTATCLLKTAALKGYNVLYTTFNDIITILMQASNQDKFDARRELMMVEFLVIDELDQRFIASENAADLYARQLENIVRTRRQNKLPTFICTNSPNITEVFTGALKESIQSIFSGYIEMFIVFGNDFRKDGGGK